MNMDETPIKETIYNYKMDLNPEEYATMLQYGLETMTQEDKERLIIEWALVDILEKECDRVLSSGSPEEEYF